jgi:hypothetical protein
MHGQQHIKKKKKVEELFGCCHVRTDTGAGSSTQDLWK